MATANPWVLPLGIFPLLVLGHVIYKFGKDTVLPDTFLSRYGPFLAPILCTLVVWLFMASVNGGDFSKHSYGNFGLLVFLPSFAFYFWAISRTYWFLPALTIAGSLFFIVCFAVGTWRSKRLATRENKKGLYALGLILILASVATVQGYTQYRSVLHPDPNYPEPSNDAYSLRRDYGPFDGNSKLVSPKKPPSLQIDQDYPKLDGAVALIPIYAAAAKAIYRVGEAQDSENLRKKAVGFSETTPAAYKALLDGRAEIIFTLAPSDEQVKEAAEKGVAYTLTPIAREAFVLLVNEQNPVTNLSAAQIRDIYSGKIKDWREVGGAPGKIMAFQRNAGSGSQTAMLRVMDGTSMREPLKAEYHESMGNHP
ncbi:MAG: substrate-binding domain-containing protein [Betaproteobacteria bacterium]|nr:substrate-binding domain-containing protein [Betaproteobacteria bacterium]